MDNQLATYYGGEVAIKSEDGNLIEVGGNLIRFSNMVDTDFHDDFFDKATNYMFTGRKQIPTMFEHGRNHIIGAKQLGLALIEMSPEEIDIMISTQLDASNHFDEMLLEQITKKRIGWSSGALPSTVIRSQTENGSHHIDQWGISEASFTFLPAEPANIATIKYLDIPQRYPVVLPDTVETGGKPVKADETVDADGVSSGELLRLKGAWLHNRYRLRKSE